MRENTPVCHTSAAGSGLAEPSAITDIITLQPQSWQRRYHALTWRVCLGVFRELGLEVGAASLGLLYSTCPPWRTWEPPSDEGSRAEGKCQHTGPSQEASPDQNNYQGRGEQQRTAGHASDLEARRLSTPLPTSHSIALLPTSRPRAVSGKV